MTTNYSRTIPIPDSIFVSLVDHCLIVKGKLGKLHCQLNKYICVRFDNSNNIIVYTTKFKHVNHKALVGTISSLINGMFIGVRLGFFKKLQLVGIGYRAAIKKGNVISLIVGLSHPVNYIIPVGVNAQCVNQTEIILNSANKQLIGQVAADLRAIKPPEPFKGKGIRFSNEIVRHKDAKKR
ncbi:50S ribosomal protein L6 [Candidatus Blochmanniella vafra str. BVAF]|uniref:50S ribosomal protein L6 n=1 Tax=Blochmanniella vafra (strain BVAF) TaxID=859654 RepID=E8Q5Z2_BLOVB|nr:50S ribosomal protein L6 [Candidatus Blochmannia vafer str. BVAF]